MKTSGTGLVGDIGGTNCRFALVASGTTNLIDPESYKGAEFPNLLDCIERYLSRADPRPTPDWAVIAVAGPIANNEVTLTNRAWHVSGPEIAKRFGIGEVCLINDFSALASAAPHIDEANLMSLGGARRRRGEAWTYAAIGPGTGLGVGCVAHGPRGTVTLATEGGHASFAPQDATEHEIVRVLSERFEHISNERLFCGDGLRNIHWALSRLAGVEPETLRAHEVSRRALAKSDPISVEAVAVFSRGLGAFAGDVVLMLGARDGLYVAGGMLPAIIDAFDRDGFRARFEAKGRFRRYMEETPAWLMIHPFAALQGAAALAPSPPR